MPIKYPAPVFLILIITLSLSSCSGTESDIPFLTPTVVVADDAFPEIDGTITSGEWDGAGLEYFEDGSELYLFQAGEFLYLAIRALPEDMISANVFLNYGDQITVLHTSAALGTAIYQQEGEHWKKTKGFDWCCRSKMNNGSAKAIRDGFYQIDGWLGINSFNGNPNELEYKIYLDDLVQGFAVNFLRAEDIEHKLVWPVGLDDDLNRSTAGGFPELMQFTPGEWESLEE